MQNMQLCLFLPMGMRKRWVFLFFCNVGKWARNSTMSEANRRQPLSPIPKLFIIPSIVHYWTAGGCPLDIGVEFGFRVFGRVPINELLRHQRSACMEQAEGLRCTSAKR